MDYGITFWNGYHEWGWFICGAIVYSCFISSNNGYVYLSVFIDDNQIYKNTNNIYVYERKKENGTYTVSAFMQIHQGGSTEYRSAEKTGEYNKSTKHIYVNFTLEDFVY